MLELIWSNIFRCAFLVVEVGCHNDSRAYKSICTNRPGVFSNEATEVTVVQNNPGTAIFTQVLPNPNTDDSPTNDLAGDKKYFGPNAGNDSDAKMVKDPMKIAMLWGILLQQFGVLRYLVLRPPVRN